MSSIQEKKETSNSLYRQWQILSRLSTGKWMGTRELQEHYNVKESKLAFEPFSGI